MPSTIENQTVQQGDATLRSCLLLGGSEFKARPVCSALDVHDLIVQGIPLKALFQLIERVGILSSDDTLNKAIGVSIRTLQRRKADKKSAVLTIEQGSQMWRFAEILAHATDALGSQEAAETWILEPAIVLENRRPIDLLASAAGAKAVADYLTRLEYGVYT